MNRKIVESGSQARKNEQLPGGSILKDDGFKRSLKKLRDLSTSRATDSTKGSNECWLSRAQQLVLRDNLSVNHVTV